MKLEDDNFKVPPSRWLDQIRADIRVWHWSLRADQDYVYWVSDFICHCWVRDPCELGRCENSACLPYLASERDEQRLHYALVAEAWNCLEVLNGSFADEHSTL